MAHLRKQILYNAVTALTGLSSDLKLFGVAGDNVDRGAMVQQSIDTVLAIWDGEPPYNIEGDYWNIRIENLDLAVFRVLTRNPTRQSPFRL